MGKWVLYAQPNYAYLKPTHLPPLVELTIFAPKPHRNVGPFPRPHSTLGWALADRFGSAVVTLVQFVK